MREIERVDRILDKLKEIWKQAPDLRFGQLLINMRLVENGDMSWHTEDNDLEENLNNFKW